MAKEDGDETRLYQCVRKYELMVKQFDELIEMMNTKTTKLPKRRKVSSSTAVPAASATQPDSNEALAQTITRFLHELSPNPTDPNCSANTHDSDPR
ncbi:hypothetical protein AAG906_014427 [Vitis piasezkii]